MLLTDTATIIVIVMSTISVPLLLLSYLIRLGVKWINDNQERTPCPLLRFTTLAVMGYQVRNSGNNAPRRMCVGDNYLYIHPETKALSNGGEAIIIFPIVSLGFSAIIVSIICYPIISMSILGAVTIIFGLMHLARFSIRLKKSLRAHTNNQSVHKSGDEQ